MGVTISGAFRSLKNFHQIYVSPTTLDWTLPASDDLGSYLGGQSVNVAFTVVVSGPAKTTSYAVTSGSLPPGLTLNQSGSITGTLTNVGASYAFTVTAENNGATATRTFTLLVDFNDDPVWSTPAGTLGSFIIGDVLHISLAASDPDSQSVTYSVFSGSLPNGVTLSGSTLTGTATTVATSNFTIRASDGIEHSDRAFSIAVAANLAPTWTTPPGDITAGLENKPHSFQLVASDPENRPLTYTVVSGSLPSGLTLNANSGLISGTAPDVSANTQYSFAVALSDGVNSVNRTFNVFINNNIPPVWTTGAGSLGSFTGNTSVTVFVAASDPNGEAVTYSLNASTLPGTLSLNANTGAISGVLPTVGTDTVYNFSVFATDGVTTPVSRAFSITGTADHQLYLWKLQSSVQADKGTPVANSALGGGAGFTNDPFTGTPSLHLPISNLGGMQFNSGTSFSFLDQLKPWTIEFFVLVNDIGSAPSGPPRLLTFYTGAAYPSTSGGSYDIIVGWQATNGNFYAGYMGSNIVGNGGTNPQLNPSTPQYGGGVQGNWHHVAVVATSGTGNFRYFVDGVGSNNAHANFTPPAGAYSGRTVLVGGGAGGWMRGLQFYDTALYSANFTPPAFPGYV